MDFLTYEVKNAALFKEKYSYVTMQSLHTHGIHVYDFCEGFVIADYFVTINYHYQMTQNRFSFAHLVEYFHKY